MNGQDIKHVSNAYINQQDLSPFFKGNDAVKIMCGIRLAYGEIGIDKSPSKIRELAKPQESGNVKRTMWFYLARNGFVKIPPKNYCEVAQTNHKRDPELKGMYVRRCRCGKRPFADKVEGYSYWIACNCGMRGMNGNDLQEAIDNWNKEDVFFA